MPSQGGAARNKGARLRVEGLTCVTTRQGMRPRRILQSRVHRLPRVLGVGVGSRIEWLRRVIRPGNRRLVPRRRLLVSSVVRRGGPGRWRLLELCGTWHGVVIQGRGRLGRRHRRRLVDSGIPGVGGLLGHSSIWPRASGSHLRRRGHWVLRHGVHGSGEHASVLTTVHVSHARRGHAGAHHAGLVGK